MHYLDAMVSVIRPLCSGLNLGANIGEEIPCRLCITHCFDKWNDSFQHVLVFFPVFNKMHLCSYSVPVIVVVYDLISF